MKRNEELNELTLKRHRHNIKQHVFYATKLLRTWITTELFLQCVLDFLCVFPCIKQTASNILSHFQNAECWREFCFKDALCRNRCSLFAFSWRRARTAMMWLPRRYERDQVLKAKTFTMILYFRWPPHFQFLITDLFRFDLLMSLCVILLAHY